MMTNGVGEAMLCNSSIGPPLAPSGIDSSEWMGRHEHQLKYQYGETETVVTNSAGHALQRFEILKFWRSVQRDTYIAGVMIGSVANLARVAVEPTDVGVFCHHRIRLVDVADHNAITVK